MDKKSAFLLTYTVFVHSIISFTYGYRLPDDVLPNHYDLEVITNLADDNDKYDFNGKVWIDVSKC